MTEREQFEGILKRVLYHNNADGRYGKKPTIAITAVECDKRGLWSPCDLIIREYLGNECYEARRLLGITELECEFAFRFICEHKYEFIAKRLVSEDGEGNGGKSLWQNYNFDQMATMEYRTIAPDVIFDLDDMGLVTLLTTFKTCQCTVMVVVAQAKVCGKRVYAVVSIHNNADKTTVRLGTAEQVNQIISTYRPSVDYRIEEEGK